jgi:hypothetical protein
MVDNLTLITLDVVSSFGKLQICFNVFRPLARSTDASMEMLRAADSSPNVMMHDSSMPNLAAGEGDEEDTGVYAESYKNATWIYIGDSEEMHVWQKPESKGEDRGEKTFILNPH